MAHERTERSDDTTENETVWRESAPTTAVARRDAREQAPARRASACERAEERARAARERDRDVIARVRARHASLSERAWAAVRERADTHRHCGSRARSQ